MRLCFTVPVGLLLLALAVTPTPTFAQAITGTISGSVTDETKAVLPGATIQVTNVETGATRTLITDERGRFRALNLSPGIYAVAAELQGFQTARRDRLVVEIGRDVAPDLQLKTGPPAEQVTVEAATTE